MTNSPLLRTTREDVPWWRRTARVTRRSTGFGYWINGLRFESADWDFEEAKKQAQMDLDEWVDE